MSVEYIVIPRKSETVLPALNRQFISACMTTARSWTRLPHVVLDYGVLAAEPMLVPESLEDPLGCMALLLDSGGRPRGSTRNTR